jgi:hypothetical protein
MDMVRVGMGEENSIQLFKARSEGLNPKVRPRVNDEAFSPRPFDEYGSPQAAIFRAGGTAYGAAAAYYGNTT